MKGLGISVPPLHAGVRFDLEALLAAFKAKNSVRFEAFGEVFAALKMSLLFAGRQTAAELIEFEEHLLQLSAAYMMSIKSGEIAGYPERFDPNAKPEIPSYARSDRPPEQLPISVMGPARDIKIEDDEDVGQAALARLVANNEYVSTLVERMFGIYCCYAFFYLQPKDYMAQIRISPAQLRDVMDFLDERLRPERHLDAMACLYKLLNEGAFRITAFELTYDPACHKRYEAEDEDECCLPPGADAPLDRMKGLTEDNTLQQLEILHRRYEEAKQQAGFKGVTHGQIDVADTAQRLLEGAKVAINMEELGVGRGGGDEGAGEAKGNSSRLDIKKRAYASGVQASRHRRYAFADGDETVMPSGAETDYEEAAATPATKKKGAAGGGTGKKRGRPSRKSQRDEQADELLVEYEELGVPGVVRRKAKSPRKSISMSGVDGTPADLLADLAGASGGRKKISKAEAKAREAEQLVRVKKSKKEEEADRDLAKAMKTLKEHEDSKVQEDEETQDEDEF